MPSAPGTSTPPRSDRWPVARSPGAVLVVVALTLAAGAAPFATGLALPVQLVIALVTLALGGHAAARLLAPGIHALKIDGARVQVHHRTGTHSTGRLIGTPFVAPLYVGFRWRPDGRRGVRALGVFRDQMAASDYRRLCAALRQRDDR